MSVVSQGCCEPPPRQTLRNVVFVATASVAERRIAPINVVPRDSAPQHRAVWFHTIQRRPKPDVGIGDLGVDVDDLGGVCADNGDPYDLDVGENIAGFSGDPFRMMRLAKMLLQRRWRCWRWWCS